jgi:hypothetical protein
MDGNPLGNGRRREEIGKGVFAPFHISMKMAQLKGS